MRDARADVFFGRRLEQTHGRRTQFHFGDEVEAAERRAAARRGRSAMRARSSRSGKLSPARPRERARLDAAMRSRKSPAHSCRAPRAERAASASSVLRAAPLSMASLREAHAVARIVDAADDLQRQRRA